jgi:hypothetical protein
VSTAEGPTAALGATVEAAADDDAAAYTRADLDEDHVVHTLRHAAPVLADRHHVNIIVHEDGSGILPGKRAAYREAVPARHDRGHR